MINLAKFVAMVIVVLTFLCPIALAIYAVNQPKIEWGAQ